MEIKKAFRFTLIDRGLHGLAQIAADGKRRFTQKTQRLKPKPCSSESFLSKFVSLLQTADIVSPRSLRETSSEHMPAFDRSRFFSVMSNYRDNKCLMFYPNRSRITRINADSRGREKTFHAENTETETEAMYYRELLIEIRISFTNRRHRFSVFSV